ncbi:DHA1 family inner membrane transport protein [Raoultella ornithinolytica]|uniref:DHA1 family inner membrane transport protein n=1 Tax=Raoultella ornithinolytica TaxID=54291 RepID=A0ABD7QP34_RAOOR|nr:DHA1 family inner membrane transport protein [Raoultella ornithinolytica]
MHNCETLVHADIYDKDNLVRPPINLFAAILTLALGGLFIGTGEFATMSLLPSLAKATQVSIPIAGQYISSYAAGVVVGAPLMAVIGARWPRKWLLYCLLLIALLGYIFSALAWNYSSLMIARFISGLPHGAWYGVAGLAASVMVPESRRTQYIGYVMLGLAAANVAGVPAMTWLGQELGWRVAFSFVAAGVTITAGMLYFFIPSTPPDRSASPLTELSALAKPQVWLTLAVATVGFGGMFAVYSFITPTLTQVSHFSLSEVPAVLVLWGIGMVCGNIIGGWMADKSLIPAIFVMLFWNIGCLALFALVAQWKWAVLLALFLLGNGFALVPALQSRLMTVASDAQTLAASLNHSAFNLSNAIGASLGGMAIAAGAGWATTGWVGAALASGGVVFMVLSVIVSRRNQHA